MSRLLLDTHTYLWFVFDDSRLSEKAASAVSDPETEILLSVASLWEITIKRQLGKLELGMGLETFFRRFVEQRRLQVLPIELPHLTSYDALPLNHRDPFDRLLLGQATSLQVPIVTADSSFGDYEIEVIW